MFYKLIREKQMYCEKLFNQIMLDLHIWTVSDFIQHGRYEEGKYRFLYGFWRFDELAQTGKLLEAQDAARLSLLSLTQYPEFLFEMLEVIVFSAVHAVKETATCVARLAQGVVTGLLSMLGMNVDVQYPFHKAWDSFKQAADSVAAVFLAAVATVVETLMIPADMLVVAPYLLFNPPEQPEEELDEAKCYLHRQPRGHGEWDSMVSCEPGV